MVGSKVADGTPTVVRGHRGRLVKAGALMTGVIVGAILVIASLPAPVHGRLTGQVVALQYCPPGDHCPLIPNPPLLNIPAGVWVWLNWTALNGSSVNVVLSEPTAIMVEPPCHWWDASFGLCEFHSPDGPGLAMYELRVGAVVYQNVSLPVIDYTFNW